MARPRLAVAVAALGGLCAPAAAHGRRAQAWSAAADHIWGTCGSHWNAKEDDDQHLPNTTCPLVDGWTCAARLSDGPADADIQVTLGNLPPSTPEDDVHLQWWATYKSVYHYDPLSGPDGSAVYEEMGTAYPKYWSEGFNGGNVRVDESGAAVVRVRSPSTYYVRPYLSYPHVHFRVCQGNASAQFYYDSLVILTDGLKMVTRSQDTAITILSQQTYSGTGVQDDDYDIPEPMGILVVNWPTTSSSSLAVSTTSTTSTNEQQWLEVVLDAAKEELLLDALEFSPVYECLADQNVYDHFAGDCADECPGHADLHAGQCVLPKQEGDAVSLTAVWRLEVDCQDLCGKSMEKETLHNIRLSVAGHLDIPFQEVAEAALIWPTNAQRRLNGGVEVVLSVKVSTERYDLDVGVTSLGAFLDNLGPISQLLGMSVTGATRLDDDPEGDVGSNTGGSEWTITSDSDPFELAYDALRPRGDSDADAPAAEESLTDPIIIAAVVGALVCGGVFGLLAWKLRQWRLGQLPENQPETDLEQRPPVVAGLPVEDHVYNVDAKTADLDFGAKADPKLAWS